VFYRVLYTRDLFQLAFLLFSMMKESLWGIQYQSLKNNAGNSAGTKISENVSRLLHPGGRNTHVHREERRLFKSGQDLSNLVQWNKRLRIFFSELQFRMHAKAYGLFCRFLFDLELEDFLYWGCHRCFHIPFRKYRANIFNRAATDSFHIILNPSVAALNICHVRWKYFSDKYENHMVVSVSVIFWVR
jgi:hypothetical protein